MDTKKTQQATILIVDDELVSVSALQNSLDSEGFHTVIAEDGEEALQQAKVAQPDLILLDVGLPGIDGFETCRRLKEQETTQEIPIIFMTAFSDILSKLQGFEAGGVDYVTKPLHPEEVIARMNTHLTIRKQQRQLQTQNERLEAQNRLIQEQREQLAELNAGKDKFISIISHDLRSPFAGMFILVEQLAQNVKNQKYEWLNSVISQLQTSMEKYQALLENLLIWGKVQQGIIEYSPRPVDLQLIVARNIALFSPTAKHKELALKSSIEERIVLSADIDMLDTVLRNLLSNAIKFTKPGGTIEVSAMPGETHVTVAVSDTGIGINNEKLPKLFRIDAKYQRRGTAGEKGTGLGLILCKEFIEKHGGRIWVESEAGKGTTIKFTLPKFLELSGS